MPYFINYVSNSLWVKHIPHTSLATLRITVPTWLLVASDLHLVLLSLLLLMSLILLLTFLCHFWSSEESHHSEPSNVGVVSLVPSLQLRVVECLLGLPVEYLHLIVFWPYAACAPQNVLSEPVCPSSDPCRSVSGISCLT